jgi:hypothetical protein
MIASIFTFSIVIICFLLVLLVFRNQQINFDNQLKSVEATFQNWMIDQKVLYQVRLDMESKWRKLELLREILAETSSQSTTIEKSAVKARYEKLSQELNSIVNSEIAKEVKAKFGRI